MSDMKRLFLLMIPLAALALLLTGCYTNIINVNDSDGGDGGGKPEPIGGLVFEDPLQLDQHIFAESQICEIRFTASTAWQAQVLNEQMGKWASVSPSSSQYGGSHTLSIIIDENTTGSDRRALVRISSGQYSQNVSISQSPQLHDGSHPPFFEPDPHTDIVEKISYQVYFDQEPNAQYDEWHLLYYGLDLGLEHHVVFDGDGQKELIERISITDNLRHIEHDLLFSSTKLTVELSVNDHNFVTHQISTVQSADNPEPAVRETSYLYSNYRRVGVFSGSYLATEYRWVDGNMVEEWDVMYGGHGESTLRRRCSYLDTPNNVANVDLNALLWSMDMYDLVGLYGKRSQSLLSSIETANGEVISFTYSFDDKRRVQTITGTSSSSPLHAMVFTIHYGESGGSK